MLVYITERDRALWVSFYREDSAPGYIHSVSQIATHYIITPQNPPKKQTELRPSANELKGRRIKADNISNRRFFFHFFGGNNTYWSGGAISVDFLLGFSLGKCLPRNLA